MGLVDLERAMLSLCFRAEPPREQLALLGDAPAWLVYREMVRERLSRELRVALPRSCQVVPASVFEHTFVWHLEHRPPRTRYFREVVAGFVASALPLWAAEPALPTQCCDLLRYELALWEVADLPLSLGAPVAEFGFDRVPVVAPALQLLELAHTVHLPEATGAPSWLCVHRANDGERPRTWSLTATTHTFLQRLCLGTETVTESVTRMAAEQGARIDARYVDALCETLAQFLEVGILLGSR